jgi:hypothetical protein
MLLSAETRYRDTFRRFIPKPRFEIPMSQPAHLDLCNRSCLVENNTQGMMNILVGNYTSPQINVDVLDEKLYIIKTLKHRGLKYLHDYRVDSVKR